MKPLSQLTSQLIPHFHCDAEWWRSPPHYHHHHHLRPGLKTVQAANICQEIEQWLIHIHIKQLSMK